MILGFPHVLYIFFVVFLCFASILNLVFLSSGRSRGFHNDSMMIAGFLRGLSLHLPSALLLTFYSSGSNYALSFSSIWFDLILHSRGCVRSCIYDLPFFFWYVYSLSLTYSQDMDHLFFWCLVPAFLLCSAVLVYELLWAMVIYYLYLHLIEIWWLFVWCDSESSACLNLVCESFFWMRIV